MGYDMGMAQTPEAGTSDQHENDPGYFRANIWGMGILRGIGWRMGLFTEDVPPIMQEITSHGWFDSDGEFHHLDSEDDEGNPIDNSAAVAEYDEIVKTIESLSPLSVDGMYIGKFGSNDGWWVTPLECQVALEKLPDTAEEFTGHVITAVFETEAESRASRRAFAEHFGRTPDPEPELDWDAVKRRVVELVGVIEVPTVAKPDVVLPEVPEPEYGDGELTVETMAVRQADLVKYFVQFCTYVAKGASNGGFYVW